MPKHVLSSSQTSVPMNVESLPCGCWACLIKTALYSLVCKVMGPLLWILVKGDPPLFLFCYTWCCYCLLLARSYLPPLWRMGEGLPSACFNIKMFVILSNRNLALLVYRPLSSFLIVGLEDISVASSWFIVKHNIPYRSGIHVLKVSPGIWTFTYPKISAWSPFY